MGSSEFQGAFEPTFIHSVAQALSADQILFHTMTFFKYTLNEQKCIKILLKLIETCLYVFYNQQTVKILSCVISQVFVLKWRPHIRKVKEFLLYLKGQYSILTKLLTVNCLPYLRNFSYWKKQQQNVGLLGYGLPI